MVSIFGRTVFHNSNEVTKLCASWYSADKYQTFLKMSLVRQGTPLLCFTPSSLGPLQIEMSQRSLEPVLQIAWKTITLLENWQNNVSDAIWKEVIPWKMQIDCLQIPLLQFVYNRWFLQNYMKELIRRVEALKQKRFRIEGNLWSPNIVTYCYCTATRW